MVSPQIEKISKTKELIKALAALGFSDDIAKSHDPRTKVSRRRMVARRYFRNSVLIVAKDATAVEKAGRNIPGVDVLGVDSLRVEKLAPGAKPRLTLWSEAAIQSIASGIAKSTATRKAKQ